MLKNKLRRLCVDLITGWRLTFRRWSVLITAANGAILTGVGLAAIVWQSLAFVVCGIVICVVLAIASIVAANLTQANMGTYDKRQWRLEAIEPTAAPEPPIVDDIH